MRCERVLVAALGLMRTAIFDQNHAQRVIAIADQLRRTDGVNRNGGAVNDVDKASALQGKLGTKSSLILRPEIEPDVAAADFLAVHWEAITLRQRIGIEASAVSSANIHSPWSRLHGPAFTSNKIAGSGNDAISL